MSGSPDTSAGAGEEAQEAVLIVEDEPLVAILLAEAVQARGLRVGGPHPDAGSALDAIGQGRHKAALLDVSLGTRGTSREVADALAERKVPFAFVTGYGPETAAVVAAHPDRLVIPKPLDAETLDILLDELLG